MTTPGETLGNTSGETSGSQQPQVERGAVLSRIADGLANLGVLKQAGVTDPGADPIAPPIASSEQPIGSTDTMGGPETAEGAIGVPDPTGRHESNFDPKQLMALLLEQNAALAEQNRLAAKKQRKEAKRERAETAAHQATMEAAAREQVEAATATHGALEGLAAEQQEANRLAAEAAEATYRLQYEANAPELKRQAAAQQAAEQAVREAAERLEARPQWVKDLEGQLEQAASTGGDLGSIVISALINRGKTIRPHLPEPNPDNYGKDHFNYTILDPATGKPELIVKGQQTKRNWYGRKVTTEVTGPRRETLIFTSTTRTPHAQSIGYNRAPVESIAIDRETGELYTCKGPNAQLLDDTAIKRLYEGAGAAKPKTPQDYLGVAVSAMKLLSEGLNMLPNRQPTSRENTTHSTRSVWDAPPLAYDADDDDDPTIVLR